MSAQFHLADRFDTAAAQIPPRFASKSNARHLTYGVSNARKDAMRANAGRWKFDHVANFGSGGAIFSRGARCDINAALPIVTVTDDVGLSETGLSALALPSDEGMMRLRFSNFQATSVDGHLGEVSVVAFSGNILEGCCGDLVKSAETLLVLGGRLRAVSEDLSRTKEIAAGA